MSAGSYNRNYSCNRYFLERKFQAFSSCWFGSTHPTTCYQPKVCSTTFYNLVIQETTDQEFEENKNIINDINRSKLSHPILGGHLKNFGEQPTLIGVLN